MSRHILEVSPEAQPVRAVRLRNTAAAQPAREARARAAPDAGFSFALDRDWRVTRMSLPAAVWGGDFPEDVVGADLRTRAPIARPLAEAVERVLATGTPTHVEFASMVIPGRWVAFDVAPARDGVELSFQDITRRMMMEHSRLGPEGTPSPVGETGEIALLDRKGTIVSVNAAWRAAIAAGGLRIADGGVGMAYVDVCRMGVSDLDLDRLSARLAEIARGRVAGFEASYAVGASPRQEWRRLEISPLKVGAAAYVLVLHEDLTERQRVEAAVRETSRQLLVAQESERRRIALELHDSTSQHLVALGLGIQRLRRLAGGGDDTAALLEEMSQSAQAAMKETRLLSFVLNGAEAEREGLEHTVRRFVEGYGRRSGLTAQFSCRGSLEGLTGPARHAVYRVIQEAMTNVYRHAAASEVSVELTRGDGRLVVRVADDGRGIVLTGADPEAPPGVGITGMRFRMEQLGGRLDIARGGRGTVVTATLPVAGAA